MDIYESACAADTILEASNVTWKTKKKKLEAFILTNEEVQCVYKNRKGLFSKPTEEIVHFNLSNIPTKRKKLQVKAKGKCLEIHFGQTKECFSFSRSSKSEVSRWADEINHAAKALATGTSKTVKPRNLLDEATAAFVKITNEVTGYQCKVPQEAKSEQSDVTPEQINNTPGEPAKRCPACREILTVGAKFCQSCGILLERNSDKKQLLDHSADKVKMPVKSKKENATSKTKSKQSEAHESNSADIDETLVIVFVFLVVAILGIGLLVYRGVSAEKRAEEELNNLVSQVEKCIKNEDFDTARIKANQIYATHGGSSTEEKWDAIRNSLLETIDKKEEAQIVIVAAPYSAEECIEKNYVQIKQAFDRAGFVNISDVKVEDLKGGDSNRVGTIESISVGDEKVFVQGQEFEKRDPVIVYYHAYEKYAVTLHIDFLSNLIFSTYDVNFLVDGESVNKLPHGTDRDFSLNLEYGEHKLSFVSAESSAVMGEVSLIVDCDMDVAYEISCNSGSVSVDTKYIDRLVELAPGEVKVDVSVSHYLFENYEDVTAELEKLGFTNIKYKVLYDIVLGWTEEGEVKSVTINGNSDFTRGTIFNTDDEVIITYHMPEDDDPSRIKMVASATDYEGKHYSELQELFNKIGFTNVVLEKTETTNASYHTGEVYRITIDYEHFESGDTYEPTDKVLIKYYSVKEVEAEHPTQSTEATKPTEPNTSEVNTSEVVLPPTGSKLGKDFDTKGTNTVYYINVGGEYNKPKLKEWGSAIVTDGVAAYLDYLKDLGFKVTITDSSEKEPYSGFRVYETNFKISNSQTSWTMYLMIQDEKYIEYELDIHLS